MRRLASLAALALLLAGLASAQTPRQGSAQAKTTVSVMDFDVTTGLSAREMVLLTNKLMNSLVEYRVFEVVERSKRDEILREQGFQLTGACSDASCLVEAGQLLGAQKMIGGTVGRLGSLFVVELRMIDIQTGGVDLSFSRNYKEIAELLTAMREAAEIFSAWKPGAGLSAKPGGLFIASQPEGAKIMVDGRDVGKTTPDLVFPLSEGLHQVSLVKDGFSLYSASRLVGVGKVDTLKAPLMSLAGKLRISATPSGAKVYLNKRIQGEITPQPMVIENLGDSVYRLKVSKWGYGNYDAVVRPTPGRETGVSAGLPLRRLKVHFASLEYIRYAKPSVEEEVASDPSLGQYLEIGNEDLHGTGGGGKSGMSFALSRNLSLGLVYQLRHLPHIIGNQQNVWTVLNGQLEEYNLGFVTHSALATATVSVPWGRVEPYGEVFYGVGLRAKVQGDYRREYWSRPDFNSDWSLDSVFTIRYDDDFRYSTLQAGGGLHLWLRPHREALRFYCLFNQEWFKGLEMPSGRSVDLSKWCLLFGAGITVHF